MTARQQAAVAAYHHLIRQPPLRDCLPTLAGTFPLGLDVESSDLDVICHTENPTRFTNRLSTAFGRHPGFRVRVRNITGLPTVVAKFWYRGFPVEVFAQSRPAHRQRAVRHLNVERRLLGLGGKGLRDCVLDLKRLGFKTEPAFAQCLGLDGDPYQALLDLAGLGDAELRKLLSKIDRAGPLTRAAWPKSKAAEASSLGRDPGSTLGG